MAAKGKGKDKTRTACIIRSGNASNRMDSLFGDSESDHELERTSNTSIEQFRDISPGPFERDRPRGSQAGMAITSSGTELRARGPQYTASEEEQLQDARDEDIHNANGKETSLNELRTKQRLDRGFRRLRRNARSMAAEISASQRIPATSPLETPNVSTSIAGPVIQAKEEGESKKPVMVTPTRKRPLSEPQSLPLQARLEVPTLKGPERLWLDRKREGENLHMRGLFNFLHVAKKRELLLEKARRELDEEIQCIHGEIVLMEGQNK